MEVNGQLHVPAALSQGTSLQYPLDGQLHGAQNQSGPVSEEEKKFTPVWNRNRLCRSSIAPHSHFAKRYFMGKPGICDAVKLGNNLATFRGHVPPQF